MRAQSAFPEIPTCRISSTYSAPPSSSANRDKAECALLKQRESVMDGPPAVMSGIFLIAGSFAANVSGSRIRRGPSS